MTLKHKALNVVHNLLVQRLQNILQLYFAAVHCLVLCAAYYYIKAAYWRSYPYVLMGCKYVLHKGSCVGTAPLAAVHCLVRCASDAPHKRWLSYPYLLAQVRWFPSPEVDSKTFLRG